ncbi:BTB/POZ domain-containing protein [Aspergillus homomorphus CBS 101889]|uniref:BTB domain-containing protein n=1 Tax=Aspergillus homomorphus (strain CBS 101889) TaxID=1450537 RepID=A0A395HMX7_ASPHC|nr:hypothetical protein BO97DRAFT_460054 [Aspergillus homomorphus CBS 101889]RAL08773.1 hypothetical protein BO97DRAFT_460054 [Aspergillus homomorphus CBS 101889]
MSASQSPHNQVMYDWAKSGKRTDFSLVCGDRTFPVHQLVVCTQVPAFAAACEGGFQEGRSRVYRIEGFEPSSVGYLVEYLYMGDYNMSLPGYEGDDKRTMDKNMEIITKALRAHAEIIKLADYFILPRLQHLAREKVIELIESECSNAEMAFLLRAAHTITGDAVICSSIMDHLHVDFDSLDEDFIQKLFPDAFSRDLLQWKNGQIVQLMYENDRLRTQIRENVSEYTISLDTLPSFSAFCSLTCGRCNCVEQISIRGGVKYRVVCTNCPRDG